MPIQLRLGSVPSAGLVAPSKQAMVPSTGPRPTAPVTATFSAERRQRTIMFCEMVESSALLTRLDPEEQRDVVSAFQSCCALS
jgi:hypothetical protein